ncbi:cellulose biosynthesis protein BcsO [Leclercia adecarboxylata]|uniref:cellulose biosynthesis protein BcsO n=1 Tax=Leclercia adecarboxylata TaxID=83655 RepID=UPI0012AA7FA5|nr:cellulose biosynthesis protein BcsO [Leclercia adecarboxylata]QFH66716.1 cellulose biosynthesis protein BcsO [Leclercia adecarboxylata]QGP85426.1 cellulose biosynthesis protein BcsO [Leclercia adecarboxylata]
MKNYDDLQRFKDKTRTGDINFKDLSAQNKQASNSGWAIINQLAGVDSDAALAKAGSVAVPVPQAMKPGELDAAFASLTKTPAAEPVGSAPSILQSLSHDKAENAAQTQRHPAAPSLFEQLHPEVTPHASMKETPVVAAPSAFHPAPALAPAPAPAQAVAPLHASAPAQAPAEAVTPPKPTEPVRFDQLFATKTSGRASHPVKDLPLQPLLEKIASCR